MSNDYLHGSEVEQVNNPKAPIQLVRASTVGCVGVSDDADPVAFPAGTTVLCDSKEMAAKAGKGPLAVALDDIYRQAETALVIVRREESGADEAATLAALIGQVNADGTRTGIEAMMSAKGEPGIGYKPNILICPGYSKNATVGAKLQEVAIKLKGLPIIDGASAEIGALDAQRSQYTKAIVVAPKVITTDGESYMSATAAGHIVRVDSTLGYHHSPSNKDVLGIVGTNPTIDHEPGETTSLSNRYSEAKICTIIKQKNGFKFWGAELSDGSLINHHRISQVVAESVLRAQEDAVDELIDTPYIDFVLGQLDDLISNLSNNGIIQSGRAWLDRDLNNDASIANRQIFFDYELVYYQVATRTTYRQHARVSSAGEIFDQTEG